MAFIMHNVTDLHIAFYDINMTTSDHKSRFGKMSANLLTGERPNQPVYIWRGIISSYPIHNQGSTERSIMIKCSKYKPQQTSSHSSSWWRWWAGAELERASCSIFNISCSTATSGASSVLLLILLCKT